MSYTGILTVNKERGYTSHDVVAKLRGICGQRKIGHTGTLDPEAEGVLPVCLGNGTKVCSLLTDMDKTYRAKLLLGIRTDTQDMTGEVLEERSLDGISPNQVREAVLSFVGVYEQIPPMYSALKVNGKRLYELAREGKTVERKARRVEIQEIVIEEIELPRVSMTVTCSKGTYIRTLCQDIGEKLGSGGCMEALVRTRVGQFTLEQARTLSDIQKVCQEGHLEELLLPVDHVFKELPRGIVSPEGDRLVYNGNPLGQEVLQIEDHPQGGQCRIYDSQGQFMGIYKYEQETNRWKPVKMFLPG